MSEISETEIKSMTKEQNYLRGYADCEKDLSFKNLDEIKIKLDDVEYKVDNVT